MYKDIRNQVGERVSGRRMGVGSFTVISVLDIADNGVYHLLHDPALRSDNHEAVVDSVVPLVSFVVSHKVL